MHAVKCVTTFYSTNDENDVGGWQANQNIQIRVSSQDQGDKNYFYMAYSDAHWKEHSWIDTAVGEL